MPTKVQSEYYRTVGLTGASIRSIAGGYSNCCIIPKQICTRLSIQKGDILRFTTIKNQIVAEKVEQE